MLWLYFGKLRKLLSVTFVLRSLITLEIPTLSYVGLAYLNSVT